MDFRLVFNILTTSGSSELGHQYLNRTSGLPANCSEIIGSRNIPITNSSFCETEPGYFIVIPSKSYFKSIKILSKYLGTFCSLRLSIIFHLIIASLKLNQAHGIGLNLDLTGTGL